MRRNFYPIRWQQASWDRISNNILHIASVLRTLYLHEASVLHVYGHSGTTGNNNGLCSVTRSKAALLKGVSRISTDG